jgi:hypothetical protein
MTPQSLKPAGGVSAQPVQDPTVRDLMQMGRMAASVYAGGGFASGGVVPHMADGGSMDFDRIIAMQQGMYGQMGRPAGLNIPAGQSRDPVKSMELMKPSAPPAPMKSGMQEAMDAYKQAEQAGNMASSAYGAGKTALFGKEEVQPTYNQAGQQMTAGSQRSRGLIGMGGQYKPEEGYFSKPEELLPEFMRSQAPVIRGTGPFASGGVVGRRGYQTAGAVDDPYYDPAAIAAQDAIERENRDPAANRPFVSAPVSEAERASGMPAMRHSGTANAMEDLQHEHGQALRDEAMRRVRAIQSASEGISIPSRNDVAPVNENRSPSPFDSNESAIGRVRYTDPLTVNSSDDEIRAAVDRTAGAAAPPPSLPTGGVAPPTSATPAAPQPAGGVAPPRPAAPTTIREVAPVRTPGMGDYAERVAMDESGGGRNLQNPRSSAAGYYGFLQSSWNDIRRANPDLNLPATVNESTPEQQRLAFDRFTLANANTLERLGRTADYPTLRLAHYFGAGGANALLGIDPNTRFDQLSDEFVRTRLGTGGQGPQSLEQLLTANPNLRGMTVGQLIEDYRTRYGNVGQPRGGEAPAPRQEAARQPAPGVAGAAPVNDVSYGRMAGQGEPLRPISQQDMESVRSRVLGEQRPASGGEGEGGLGSAIMNEKFLVPLLAGLSGMASSPSRYLGSAILQGLGAGALQYEKMANALPQRQKTQAEAYQQESAMRERLLNEFESYKALTGDFGLTLEEFSRRLGIPYRMALPAPSTVPSRQRAEPAPGDRSQMDLSLQGYRTETVKYPTGETVSASDDPGYLRQFIARNSAIPAPTIARAVEDARTRLAQIEASGRTTDITGKVINIPNILATRGAEQLNQANVAESAKFIQEGNEFSQRAISQMSALKSLDRIYQNYNAQGLAAGPIANLAALANALGIGDKLPAGYQNSDAKFQEAWKLVTSQIINSASQLPGNAMKTELTTLARTVAEPSLSPEASRNIIIRMKAALDYQNEIFRNYNTNRGTVREYLDNANLDDLWNRSVKKAEEDTPQYGGRSGRTLQQVMENPTPEELKEIQRIKAEREKAGRP